MGLTLTRCLFEQIVIDVPPSTERTQVVVGVRDIAGNRVKLGTAAPPQVRILRAELHPEFEDHPLLKEFGPPGPEDVGEERAA